MFVVFMGLIVTKRWMAQNQMTGTIPPELSTLDKLVYLYAPPKAVIIAMWCMVARLGTLQSLSEQL